VNRYGEGRGNSVGYSFGCAFFQISFPFSGEKKKKKNGLWDFSYGLIASF